MLDKSGFVISHQQKRMRLGLLTGGLAFCAGWAAIALLAPQAVFDAPRWQSTLWMFLGANAITLTQGAFNQNTVQPVTVAELPELVYLIPVVAVTFASAYVCYNIRTSRVKQNVSNAMAAGTGYFLTALVAMILSDIRPSITVLLMIALVFGGGLWVGSTVMGTLSRGIPFLGVASLGTVVTVGVLVLFGGVAILSVIQDFLVVTFAPTVAVGAGFGVSRQLERRGRRSDYPRISGLQQFFEESWKETLVVSLIFFALLIGLTGGM